MVSLIGLQRGPISFKHLHHPVGLVGIGLISIRILQARNLQVEFLLFIILLVQGSFNLVTRHFHHAQNVTKGLHGLGSAPRDGLIWPHHDVGTHAPGIGQRKVGWQPGFAGLV